MQIQTALSAVRIPEAPISPIRLSSRKKRGSLLPLSCLCV